MSNLLLVILLFIIMLVSAVVFGMWFMSFIIKKYIGEKHIFIETIVNTGKVPESWTKKFDKKINKLVLRGCSEEEVSTVVNKANKKYRKRLKKLFVYMSKTNLVEDENTRELFLTDIQALIKKSDVRNSK